MSASKRGKKGVAAAAAAADSAQPVLSRFFAAAVAPKSGGASSTTPPAASLVPAAPAASAAAVPAARKPRAPAKRKAASAAADADEEGEEAKSAAAAASPSPAPPRSKRPRAAAAAASSKLREVVSISDDEDESSPAAAPAAGKSATVKAESKEDAEATGEEADDVAVAEAPARKRGKAAPVAAASSFLASSAFTSLRKPEDAAAASSAAAANVAAASSPARPASSSSASPPRASAARPMHSLFAQPGAAAAAAVASPFKPRTAVIEKLSLPASAVQAPADPHAHQKYVDELIAHEFAVESATDPSAFNSYERAPVLGGAAASKAAAAASANVASPTSSSSSSAVSFHQPPVFDLVSWSGVPGTTAASKFTPLEQQVLAVKRRHPDVFLLVEVGYKFRMFGADAELAAHLLDIYAHPSHHLLTASIPTYRLYIHVKRLLEAGLKVGVVRQTESAASKKLGTGTSAGDKSTPLFTRDISELYTKATAVPELGDEARVHCDLVGVDPSGGEVVWDSFDSDYLRTELETRLVQLAPAEVLVSSDPAKLSTNSAQMLLSFAEASAAATGGEGVRLEKLDAKRYKFSYTDAAGVVARFFAESSTKAQAGDEQQPASPPRKQVHVLDDDDGSVEDHDFSSSSSSSSLQSLGLPKGAIICLGVLIPYLRSFGLDAAFRIPPSAFRRIQLASRVHMGLDGLTLHNLEIARTQEGPVQGSLLWLLQHTKTAFGARMLRKWVLNPLSVREDILARLDAVDELLSADTQWTSALNTLLHQLPDLERGMARVQYAQCKPVEFLRLLEAFNRVVEAFPTQETIAGMTSALCRKLFSSVDFPAVRSSILFALGSLNSSALEAGVQSEFFTDPSAYPSILAAKGKIDRWTGVLQDQLLAARKTLGPEYARMEFLSVNTSEFLLEVKSTDVKRVPKSWVQVNATKTKHRYHTPEIIAALDQLSLAREELTAASGAAWKSFLASFASPAQYALFRPLIECMAEFDCLTSLAVVAALPGFVRPEIVDEQVLEIKQGRHPMIESSGILASGGGGAGGGSFVPNDANLHATAGPRFAIITGANMGGKSTYLRMVALIVVLAQIGSFVPAESARLGVFDSIFTRMGARDQLLAGRSTFFVEISETNSILRRATEKSLIILDELGRGTSTADGLALAHATSEFILLQIKCITLFVTHYGQTIGKMQDRFPALVRNFHMAYVEEKPAAAPAARSAAGDDADPASSIPLITFLYSLAPGIAPSSFGINVARMARVPESVLRRAATMASRMRTRNEQDTKRREAAMQREAVDTVMRLMRRTAAPDTDEEKVKRVLELRVFSSSSAGADAASAASGARAAATS